MKKLRKCVECGAELILYSVHRDPSIVSFLSNKTPVVGAVCPNCGLIHPVNYILSNNKKVAILKDICYKFDKPFSNIWKAKKTENFKDIKDAITFSKFIFEFFDKTIPEKEIRKIVFEKLDISLSKPAFYHVTLDGWERYKHSQHYISYINKHNYKIIEVIEYIGKTEVKLIDEKHPDGIKLAEYSKKKWAIQYAIEWMLNHPDGK